jgi:arsenate reductase
MTREHWPLPDPAAAAGPGGSIVSGFRVVRDDIAARVAALFGIENPLAAAEDGP